MCHATNVRKMREVKSILRKQANLRKAEAAKARGASQNVASAPGVPGVPFADAPVPFADAPNRASAPSFREQIENFDAKHNREGTLQELPRGALRGSATREESDSQTASASASVASASASAVPPMTHAEETMFLDVLMMNYRLMEEN